MGVSSIDRIWSGICVFLSYMLLPIIKNPFTRQRDGGVSPRNAPASLPALAPQARPRVALPAAHHSPELNHGPARPRVAHGRMRCPSRMCEALLLALQHIDGQISYVYVLEQFRVAAEPFLPSQASEED